MNYRCAPGVRLVCAPAGSLDGRNQPPKLVAPRGVHTNEYHALPSIASGKLRIEPPH